MEQWYPGCRRDGDRADANRLDDAVDSRVRRHCEWATTPKPTCVDRWGLSHEAPNLGILGASVMGTSGAQKSDAHGSGARLANRRASRKELEFDSQERMNVRAWLPASAACGFRLHPYVWLPASAGRSMPQPLPMVVGPPTPEQQQQSADDRENRQGLHRWRWSADDIRGVGDQEKHCEAQEGPMADLVPRPGRVHVEP